MVQHGYAGGQLSNGTEDGKTATHILYFNNGADSTKFVYQPFIAEAIRPYAFPDGTYTMYWDSTKQTVRFQGVIVHGLTTGNYFNLWEDSLSAGADTLHVVNGKLDGLVKTEMNFQDFSEHYYFYFKEGLLWQMKILDPFIRYNEQLPVNEQTALAVVSDTLSLYFGDGQTPPSTKGLTATFTNLSGNWQLQQDFRPNWLRDTTGIVLFNKAPVVYRKDVQVRNMPYVYTLTALYDEEKHFRKFILSTKMGDETSVFFSFAYDEFGKPSYVYGINALFQAGKELSGGKLVDYLESEYFELFFKRGVLVMEFN